nr:hypothetical protein [Tanacetum cinerariifolium]
MGRDTVQLETVVSTISQEYLLEFTSEYGISEALHPELPGPEDMIVDFSESKARPRVDVFQQEAWEKYPAMLHQALRLPKKLEQLLLLGGREGVPNYCGLAYECSKRWDAGREYVFPKGCENTEHTSYPNPETTRGTTLLSGVKPQMLPGRRDMDLFNLIRAPNPTKVKTGSRPRAAYEVPLLIITANRVTEMKDPTAATDSSGVPSTIERSPLDFANENPSQQSTGPEDQETAALEVPPLENVTTMGGAPEAGLAERVAAIDPLTVKERRKRGHDGVDTNAPPKVPRRDHADPCPTESTREGKSLTAIELGMGSTRPTPTPQGALWTMLDTPEACQDLVDHVAPPGYFSKLRHLHNDDFLKQYNVNLARKVAMGSQLRLRFEQEAKLLKKSVAQVARRDKRIQARENEIKNLETLLEAEANMKKAAEDKSAELSQELENMRALVSDLQVSNNRLSQQVSTLQEQVNGEEKLKAAFEEFKQYEDNRAKLDLEAIEAYDPEAEAKYIAALHALKNMKYPLVDQLKSLKDALMDVIMASLHLKSDTGDDAPQWVRELRPSSSQLTIPVYPEVRDPMDPWACKEEILFADAIAANVSRAEKKKKCRVVCRTHGVGSAQHARSDGVLVFVPTVSPQGLAILLADAATQTETSDEASPQLLRSSSLHVIHG